jgi:pimeloyl-ACP methyl ester carboxylesterase
MIATTDPLPSLGDFLDTPDGARVWFDVLGPDAPGVPLVLCDGLGCDGFIWPYIIAAFSGSRPIVRWHYRGHGRSSPPANRARMTLQLLSQDLHAVLGALRIPRAIMAGHSLGVQVILEHARQYPEEVAALVPVCGSYGRPGDTFYGVSFLRAGLETVIELAKTVPEPFAKVWRAVLPTRLSLALTKLVEVNGDRIREEDLWPYLHHLSEMDPEVFFRLLEHALDHTTEDFLPHIAVPTLIIAGNKDGFTPARCSEQMHEAIPNSGLLMIEGGTHTAPLEFPDLINERLGAFLQEIA